MDHLPSTTLSFLADLEANNTKEWFHANKKRYEKELKEPARAFITGVNERLRGFAPEHVSDTPHKNLSRINRDIRFSKDKTPYNTHIWAGFGRRGAPKGTSAGLYIGLSPNSWGVGGGTWSPDKAHLASLRAHLADHHGELEAIIGASDFAEHFGEISGEALKRVPKPWAADHPAGHWLRFKQMHVRSEGPPEAITSPGFLDRVEARMRLLMPLIAFLQAGLDG